MGLSILFDPFVTCVFLSSVSTRVVRIKNLQCFLEQPYGKWVESSYDVDGPHYYTVLAMHILSPERWRNTRLAFLRRLLVSVHARKVSAVFTNK